MSKVKDGRDADLKEKKAINEFTDQLSKKLNGVVTFKENFEVKILLFCLPL